MGLGITLEQRSRPGGLPSLTSVGTDLLPLLMLYSGQSQVRHFKRNSTTHAQQKIKSLGERRTDCLVDTLGGEMWVSSAPIV